MFQIRPMLEKEMDVAIQLAADEGWNPGLEDASCFYRTDPSGFLIGILDGRPIGCISAVSYGGACGFVGFYIVAPEYRGQGYGIQLWNEAIKKLAGHNIGLDGVVEQQANYMKSGFKHAYRNIRYEGRARRSEFHSTRIVALKSIGLDTLCAYDRRFFPADRESFLTNWASMEKSSGVAYFDQQQILGYGVIRACRRGHKVGPLFAENAEVAESILIELMNKVEEGAPFFLDVPEINSDAINLANRYQMSKLFETARMYTGDQPALPMERIFGVTTFELG
jgi:GNAT superfamily N-acetyltransferase